MNEGINIARTVANELDSARFDPLLIKAVAKNASSSLEMMLSRTDGLVSVGLASLTTKLDYDTDRKRQVSGDYDWTFRYSWSNGQRSNCNMFISLLVPTRKVGR